MYKHKTAIGHYHVAGISHLMRNKNLLDISEWVLLAAVVVGAALTLRLAIHQFPIPYQLNYEEGNVLNAAVRITQGANPYPAIQPPIFVFNSYGPVAYYLIAPLVKYFGPAFLYPRLIICIAGLTVAALISVLLRQRGVGWKMAVSFGLLYLTMPVVRDWIFLLRVDLLAVALTLAGLTVCCLYAHGWYLAAPLFVASVYTKQTMIAAPVACCLLLVLRKEWRKAATMAALMVGLSLALFLVFQIDTHGWFAFHIFRTYREPYFLSNWTVIFLPALRACAIPVILAIAPVVRDVRNRDGSLPAIYFALATLATLTGGKVGSDTNHLLEWLASLCIAAGLGYHALGRHVRANWALALVPISLSAILLFTLPLELDVEPSRDGCPEAYAYVKGHPGTRFLSGNVGALVVAGKPVTFSDGFAYAFLVKSSTLSDQELASEIRDRYYNSILLGQPLDVLKKQASDPKSPDTYLYADFLDELQQNYHLVRQFSCTEASFAYEPNE